MAPAGRLVTLAATLLLVPTVARAQDASRFGVSGIRLACFSPQRAFAESPEGKAGIARLQALQEKRAREIDDRKKALQAREQALQQSLSVLSEEIRGQRTKELDKFRIDTERLVQDAQAEFLGVQRDIEHAFVAKLKPALERVDMTRGVELVLNLDGDTIAWVDPSLDITAEVVKQLALNVVPGNR